MSCSESWQLEIRYTRTLLTRNKRENIKTGALPTGSFQPPTATTAKPILEIPISNELEKGRVPIQTRVSPRPVSGALPILWSVLLTRY